MGLPPVYVGYYCLFIPLARLEKAGNIVVITLQKHDPADYSINYAAARGFAEQVLSVKLINLNITMYNNIVHR